VESQDFRPKVQNFSFSITYVCVCIHTYNTHYIYMLHIYITHIYIIHIYIIHTHTHIYIYIHIYIERERERERLDLKLFPKNLLNKNKYFIHSPIDSTFWLLNMLIQPCIFF
jgi:hypothetical protein